MEYSINLVKHPARAKLKWMSDAVPGIWDSFERFAPKAASAQEYISKQTANIAISETLGDRNIARAQTAMTIPQFQNMLTTFHTLATWRISQGIYRFDPDLYASVIDSVLGGEIPGDLLLRLPERSVFVETPNLTFAFTNGARDTIHGVWARIESLPGTEERAVVLQPLLASEPADPFLHAVRIPISGLIDRWDDTALTETATVRAISGQTVNAEELRQSQSRIDAWSRPVLNLLLYLCSENSEISKDGKSARDPISRAIMGGRRHIPPSLPTKWEVGVRMGAALRAARQTAAGTSPDSGGQKRAHIRRAHWHGVRVGPTKRADGEAIPTNERRFELRWLPPIFVKVENVDDLPATVRPVE
jgi:hypothetical protein